MLIFMHMFGRCTHTIEDELGSAAWKTTPLSCKRSDLEKFFSKFSRVSC